MVEEVINYQVKPKVKKPEVKILEVKEKDAIQIYDRLDNLINVITQSISVGNATETHNEIQSILKDYRKHILKKKK